MSPWCRSTSGGPLKYATCSITYNAMLFAVLALLLGVTPMTLGDLGEKQGQ